VLETTAANWKYRHTSLNPRCISLISGFWCPHDTFISTGLPALSGHVTLLVVVTWQQFQEWYGGSQWATETWHNLPANFLNCCHVTTTNKARWPSRASSQTLTVESWGHRQLCDRHQERHLYIRDLERYLYIFQLWI